MEINIMCQNKPDIIGDNIEQNVLDSVKNQLHEQYKSGYILLWLCDCLSSSFRNKWRWWHPEHKYLKCNAVLYMFIKFTVDNDNWPAPKKVTNQTKVEAFRMKAEP